MEDVFSPDEILECARKLVAAANCCNATTLKEAAKLIERDGDDGYYDEGEMLKAIAGFLLSKCK